MVRTEAGELERVAWQLLATACVQAADILARARGEASTIERLRRSAEAFREEADGVAPASPHLYLISDSDHARSTR